MKRVVFKFVLGAFFLCFLVNAVQAEAVEVLGVKFPETTVVEGKTLTLNGVGYLKKFGLLKVYVAGLYLEHPTHNPSDVIESEQVKYLITHYLTNQATAQRLSEGFVKLTEKCNSPQLIDKNRASVDLYASWIDADMGPGQTSESVYVPGKGLTLTYKGALKGTIAGPDFAQMYYRNNVGEQASESVREGLLGLSK